MRTRLWLASKFLISILVLVGGAIPVSATSCTNGAANPCTGSSSTGQDSTDRTTFSTNNSDLSFNNITFDSATGTYTALEGLDAATATGSALLYGVSFIGCISSQSPCASNSSLTVGTVANWDGSTDAALTGPSPQGGGHFVTITILLPANVFAFGVDLLNSNNCNCQAFFLVDATGQPTMSAATSVNLPGSVFYGFRSSTAISQVSFYAPNANMELTIDNFELGTMSETSEAGTMLLVASGLFALRFARRFTV
jgi:hypothetical protein